MTIEKAFTPQLLLFPFNKLFLENFEIARNIIAPIFWLVLIALQRYLDFVEELFQN